MFSYHLLALCALVLLNRSYATLLFAHLEMLVFSVFLSKFFVSKVPIYTEQHSGTLLAISVCVSFMNMQCNAYSLFHHRLGSIDFILNRNS